MSEKNTKPAAKKAAPKPAAEVGFSVYIGPTLAGVIQNGTILRLKEKGVPDLRGGRNGDQLCTVHIEIDRKLTSKEKELYTQLQKLQNNQKESIWEKFKNQFN